MQFEPTNLSIGGATLSNTGAGFPLCESVIAEGDEALRVSPAPI